MCSIRPGPSGRRLTVAAVDLSNLRNMVFLFGSCACFASFEMLQSVQCLNLVKRTSCPVENSRAAQCAHRGRIQK